MKWKRLAVLPALLLLLCSCMPRIQTSYEPAMPHVDTPTPAPTPSAAAQPRRSTADRKYGSVSLLGEPTVLVSVFLNAPGCETWTPEQQQDALDRVNLAADWLKEQAAQYGTEATLYCENAGTYTLQSAVSGGLQSDESDALLDELDTLSAQLDSIALEMRYNTTHVGFLYFMPAAGTSFTMVHYAESGDSYYHEYSCLYRYDAYSEDDTPENPATYAHEILHMFGAPDLYRGSSDPFVDDALVDYIEQNYPDEIMYSTYGADGSSLLQDIPQRITPLTAYCVGLADSCPEQELFPAVAEAQPGVFVSAEEDTPQIDWLALGAVAV